MPTNVYVAAITSALSAAIAPVLTALVIIFHWHYTTQDQGNLILAAGSLLTVAGTIVTVALLHAHAKVAVAKVNAANLSNAAVIAASSAQAGTLTHNEARAAVGLPPVRVRKSRAKPKSPPAV